MVRHPFDRLIIEYKRQKYQDTEDLNNLKSNVPGRQILFSRHRTGHGRKKNKREFREFITKSLLASNSSVEPITQVGEFQGSVSVVQCTYLYNLGL